METSGRPREGWMALVPLGAFVLFVVSASGGPHAFVRDATFWLRDAVHHCVQWVQSFR